MCIRDRTYVAQKVSGLPTERVIGSGTILDTARLRYMMSEYLDVSTSNIHAYIMGEHGDSSFVPWTNAYVGCKMCIRDRNIRCQHQPCHKYGNSGSRPA